VEFNCLQVVENLERETNIELATNSLEDYVSVENKRQARPRSCIQSHENRLSFHAIRRNKRQVE
jgi:hypothetical protein